MDCKQNIAEQDLNLANGTIYVGVHNIESVYRACVAWEKRRGIHRDCKAFGKYGWEKKEQKIKLEQPVKPPKPVKAPAVKLTAEELRERQRVRVAAYRAKNAEKMRESRKLYSKKYREKMTEEQKQNRRINEHNELQSNH